MLRVRPTVGRSQSGGRRANPALRPARALALAAVAVVCSASGCRSNPSQAEIKFLETRELHLPYPHAYDAALNAMFSMGLSITHSDKGSGIITGQSGDHALRATMGVIQRSRNPVKKVTLMVSPRTDDRSQLRMKVLINEEQELDRTLMTELWQRIEREAMLDRPPPDRQSAP